MLPPMFTFGFAATTADQTVYTGSCLLRGWMLSETAGTTATIEFWDGANENSGVGPLPIGFAANETTRDFVPGFGILIRTGIFLENLTGTIKGSVFYTPITHAEDINVLFGEWDPMTLRTGI